jgi:adenylosuccinate synthase
LRRMHETILFEGAQGVLLDKERGTKPYVTSSNTTQENARTLLTGYEGDITSLGVMRMYATRHGVGTFPTETGELNHLPEPHNTPNEYQGEMRNGWVDLELFKRAIKINGGIDGLVINHLDLWDKCAQWKLGNINYYNQRMYIEDIVGALQTPLSMIGRGYTRNEREYDYMA